MMPDPKKMAEHLKELGPEKVSEALCAAYTAMGPLCKHHTDPAKPANDAPKEIGDIASQMRGANEGRGAAWA